MNEPLLPEDRAVERLKLGSRLDPELVDQCPARVVERSERLGLPGALVEREHQVAAQLFAQRVRPDEGLDLRD